MGSGLAGWGVQAAGWEEGWCVNGFAAVLVGQLARARIKPELVL